MKNEVKGISSLLFATLLYSFFGVLTRTIGFEIPVFYGMAIRGLTSSLILFCIIFFTNAWKPVFAKDWKWFIARTLGGTFGFLGSYYSFMYVPLGTAYFIFYGGSTISGYVFGRILFKEKLTSIKWLSLGLATLGLFLIYFTRFGLANPVYMAYAFFGGVCSSMWNVFSKKISHAYADVQLNLLDFFIYSLIVIPISLVLREPWVAPALSPVWLANGLFVFMFIVTGQLMVYGFKHLEAQIGSLVMLTEILFGILVGYIFYSEVLSVWTVAGGLLILVAIIIPEVYQRKKR